MTIRIVHYNGLVALTMGEPLSLEKAQQIVGGPVELVTVTLDGVETQCLCNEEGLIHGLKPNYPVTAMLRDKVNLGSHACGTWIFLTGEDMWD